MRIARAAALLLLVCACAPAEPAPRGRQAAAATLTALEISDAMGHSMGPAPDDLPGTMCALAEDIQCAPAGRGRLQCSFRSNGKRRSAVFRRTGETEWEREGHWIWVSGWRWCGRYF